MRYRSFAAVVAVAVSCAIALPANAADVKVVIPEGTLVLTHLSDAMSSKDVHTGDVFSFVVGRDIVVDGYVAIPLGAKGVGHVTEAHSAGTHGKSGGIRLAFDYVFARNGEQVPVTHNKQAEEQDRSTLGATALGIILTGGLGLFFHNFVHGSDVTIPTSAETFVTTLAPKTIALDTVKDLAPVPGPATAAMNGSPAPAASPLH
jgi:hypothetical protein